MVVVTCNMATVFDLEPKCCLTHNAFAMYALPLAAAITTKQILCTSD